MLSEKLEKSLNEQLTEELYSAYLYLSMSAYFAQNNLDGFSNWMKIQYQEEQMHAMKIYDYIIDRGGEVILMEIKKPKNKWENPLHVMKDSLEHEKHITSLINNLMDLAKDEKDYATSTMLQWFITEQVEEESTVEKIVNQLDMMDGKGPGLFMLDKDLGSRTFNA